MTESYPFLFFDHGEIDPDSVGKCEELFIWFDRPLTGPEKKKLAETCPRPVAGSFLWGERFAYFGSDGDTYDYEIACTYGSPAFKKKLAKAQKALAEGDSSASEIFLEFGDEIAEGLPAFTADFERWAKQANELAPVTFVKGPGRDDEDAWSRWSRAHAGRAMAAVLEHARQNPWLSRGDEEGGQRAALARHFGYIRDAVMRLAFEGGDEAQRREIIESLYESEAPAGPVERLSYDEHHLQVNAGLVAQLLGKRKGEARREALSALSPFVQLAYLSSYDALDAGDLLAHPDPEGWVRSLLAALADDKKAAGPGLVAFAASSLVHLSPAFSRPDKKHQALATRLMKIALEQADRLHPEALTYAVALLSWSDPSAAAEVGRSALERFPDDGDLLGVTALAAKEANRDDLLEKLEPKLAEGRARARAVTKPRAKATTKARARSTSKAKAAARPKAKAKAKAKAKPKAKAKAKAKTSGRAKTKARPKAKG